MCDVTDDSVIGVGAMGHGIAEVAAMSGYLVSLRNVEAKLAGAGYGVNRPVHGSARRNPFVQ